MNDDTKDSIENIGRFLTNFAEVEYQIYKLLGILEPKKYSKFALKQPGFETRVRFCQVMLLNHSLSQELIDILDKSILLFKFRNKVVHNPVRIDIYMDNNRENFTAMIPEWINAKTEKPLPNIFQELNGQTKVASDVAMFLMKITQANESLN